LVAVGAGATYQQAALLARERASRFQIDYDIGELRESRHGQLVADWVELFAPVVFEPHRPQAWPWALARTPPSRSQQPSTRRPG
jgi:hypothetical protein